MYSALEPLKTHRRQIDQVFIDLVDSTSSEVLEGTIDLKRKDRVHTFPFGKILLHLFNHQTHHRGAISQILDEHGVKNDYSNLLQLLM
ncbi:MAG: DinB family protein [Spirochaetota bacterium]